MLFGYAYPAYKCFKSEEENKPDIERLRFWSNSGSRCTVKQSWCFTYTCGTLKQRPYISKHETDIGRNLSELRTMAGDMAVLYWQRAASYVQTRTFDIIQYVASQSTPKPKPSQPQKPARTRQPAPNNKGQTAALDETKESPSPAASPSASSSSSSGSGSGSHEIDQSDEVSTMPAVLKAQKVSLTKKQTVTTEVETATEPETTTQNEPSGLSSSDVNLSPAEPKETVMEVRVTRARLRKVSSK